MRILHALPALNRGGTERLVLTLAAYQQQQGHNVVVATFDPLNLWPEESEGLHIETFGCTTAIHRLLRPPVHDAQAFVNFLDRWQPDVIHSHSHWTERIILACPLQRAVLLQHFHLDYAEWQRPRLHQIRSWLGRWQLCLNHLQRGTRFLAVSQATMAYYRRHLPAPLARRLHCRPNFLALPVRSRPRSAPRTPLRLLSVGRLVPEKHHHRLLLLARELQDQGLSFELSLVGDGPLRQQLETSIQNLGLTESVHCCGNQQDLATYYDAADLLLHPATSEPFGLVILEAMARGLPCLVEQSSQGPRDFLQPGMNGLCVDFENVAGTARLLMELVGSHCLYIALSAQGMATSQCYELPAYWQKLSYFYDTKAISARRPPITSGP
jgi:glycosyltransferase involved in cell wall biosynthesis